MIIPPITQVLSVLGKSLVFDGFEILGLSGFRADKLNEFTEKQTFSFNVNTQDIVDNEITKDMEFTVELFSYLYYFKVSSPPVDAFSSYGWSIIKADFISKETL
jgi:hypothetical protein